MASKKMKSAEIRSIPQELIIEIFSCLPVKSLLRYRCVSNFFNSLVFESNFVDLHHRRSMTRPGGRKYLVYKRNVFYTVESKEDGKASLLRIVNMDHFSYYCPTYDPLLMCVHGLACSWQGVHHIAICNFNTRQVRFLRCPEEYVMMRDSYGGERVCSIGFEPQEKKYKLLLTLSFSEGYTTNWVFTLGTDKSWRKMEYNAHFSPSQRRVCANGVIYMLNYDYNYSLYNIVAFDVRAETLRMLTLPHALHLNKSTNHTCLIEVKCKLAILNYNMYCHEDMHLSILATQNDDWESHTIQFPSQVKGMDVGPYFHNMHTSCDEEILFQWDSTYICYDVTRKSWREFGEIEKLDDKYLFNKIFCFVENLFFLGKLGITNLQD